MKYVSRPKSAAVKDIYIDIGKRDIDSPLICTEKNRKTAPENDMVLYVDLYSALDDKYLVLKTLRHGSHSLTCKQHHACL